MHIQPVLTQPHYPQLSLESLSDAFFMHNPSHFFKIRIHCECIEWPQMTQFLLENPVLIFLAKETVANRDHYQGLIRCSSVKEQQLRNKIKKAFPLVTGNKGYSLSPCFKKTETAPDILKYIRYCCKGPSNSIQPDIVINDFKIVEPCYIPQLHALYWKEHKQLQLDNPNGYKKNLKTLVKDNLDSESLLTLSTMNGQSESEARAMYKCISMIIRHKLYRSAHPTQCTNVLFSLLLDLNPSFENWHYSNHQFFWQQ